MWQGAQSELKNLAVVDVHQIRLTNFYFAWKLFWLEVPKIQQILHLFYIMSFIAIPLFNIKIKVLKKGFIYRQLAILPERFVMNVLAIWLQIFVFFFRATIITFHQTAWGLIFTNAFFDMFVHNQNSNTGLLFSDRLYYNCTSM